MATSCPPVCRRASRSNALPGPSSRNAPAKQNVEAKGKIRDNDDDVAPPGGHVITRLYSNTCHLPGDLQGAPQVN